MTSSPEQDRRVRRTRQAIFEAFRTLVVSRPYDALKVGDIAEMAGVGRSTFYEHFRGKDDVLTDSITWLFDALADAAVAQPDPERLAFVLDHFHEQRRVGRILLQDRPLRLLTDRLAFLIEQRIDDELRARGAAAAQLEIIRTWLDGRCAASRETVGREISGIAVRND